jgi:fibronectin-binding autotransporter adhesin
MVTLLAFGLCLTRTTRTLAAITATGSIFDSEGSYRVGYLANGTLTIDLASVLNRTYGDVGYNSGCAGIATVTGTGSK